MKRDLAVGALIVALGVGLGLFIHSRLAPEDRCDVCLRPMHQATYYRVHLEEGGTTELCCPRCGMRYQQGREDVASSDVADFQSGEILPAQATFFVEGSSVHACVHESALKEDRSGSQYALSWDRCLPSLIAFSTRDAAEAFQRANGGKIKTYPELLAEEF